MGVLIERDNPCRADTTRAGRAGHTKAWRRSDATFPSARGKGSALLYVQSCKTRTGSIKAGQVGYLSRVSQPTAVSLPLLSELRYPRVAANLKR